jgi:hypothetical protein
MPRPVFADPKNTFVFARLFGSEQRKGITMAFVGGLDVRPLRPAPAPSRTNTAPGC